MKKLWIILFAFVFSLLLSGNLYSDPGDPPPPPSGHGEDGDQNPRGAPIGSGMAVLISLAAAYGVKKYYTKNKKSLLD
jgi:hypothetical protein